MRSRRRSSASRCHAARRCQLEEARSQPEEAPRMSSGDAIPEFRQGRRGETNEVGVTNLSALTAGRGHRHARPRCWRSSPWSRWSSSAASSSRSGTSRCRHYIMPPPSPIAVALVTDFHLILPHLGHTLVAAGRRLRHRGHDRPGARRRDHPVPLRREDHRPLHPDPRHHADAGAGAAADPPLRLRLRAPDHRGGPGLGSDGDDQRGDRLPPGRSAPRSRWPAPTAPAPCRSSGRSGHRWRCR